MLNINGKKNNANTRIYLFTELLYDCRDRRKLTFYFKANERIDFRELVRELFKIYKTRIWMCAVETE